MSNAFRIRSNSDGATLEVGVDRPRGWTVTLTAPNVRAEGSVFVWEGDDGIVAFFDDLAARWRGWDGEKAYESLEGEFALTCTHDRLGAVLIEVALRTGPGSSDSWWIRGTLVVDPGQLEGLAKDARACFPT